MNTTIQIKIPPATYLPVICDHCRAVKDGYPGGMCECCGRFGNAADLTPNPVIVMIAAEKMSPEMAMWLINGRGFPEAPPYTVDLASVGYLNLHPAGDGWSFWLTPFGHAVAKAMEARQGEDRETGLHPKDDSAVSEGNSPEQHRVPGDFASVTGPLAYGLSPLRGLRKAVSHGAGALQ